MEVSVAAFVGRGAASRGELAAWPTPADCGDIAGAAAVGGADEVGVVEGVRSQSVLRPRSRRRRAGRSGRTGLRPVVRRRRRRGRESPPLRLARRLCRLRLTCR